MRDVSKELRLCAHRGQRGTALLVTMLVLLLVSLLAITGLERSGEESVSGARLRSSTKTLHAADSGIRFALNRLRQSPPNLDAFVVPLASASVASQTRTDPALVRDDFEKRRAVRGGGIGEIASAIALRNCVIASGIAF